MKYKIEWSERKDTSTGKKKLSATLTNIADNTVVQNVSIWQDFPNFEGLMTGHTVDGDLVAAKDPKYGPKLYPVKTYKTFQSGGKSEMIEKAQERTAQMVGTAQANKESGIKTSSTIRMAVDIAIAKYNSDPILNANIRDIILKEREWLLNEWENTTTSQPFNS